MGVMNPAPGPPGPGNNRRRFVPLRHLPALRPGRNQGKNQKPVTVAFVIRSPGWMKAGTIDTLQNPAEEK